MTGAHIRIRRLSRLATRARADVVAAERRLAQAVREAATAADRAATLATILAETRPAIGAGGESLLAGAQLRQMLGPAMASAVMAKEAAALGEVEAGRRLTEAAARADGLDDRLTDMRRAARGVAERRSADLLPVGRNRK